MREIYYPSADGKNTVHACIWEPEGQIKGVVQIIHGMAEYAARYAPFAQFLNKNGYLVCAEDHLGHGKSVQSQKDLGYFNDRHDYNIVLSDIDTLRRTVQKEHADLPYFILGHSMGSFFCRNYIARYGEGLAGAVIMGSGFKSMSTLNAALFFVRLNALFCGWRNRSKFIKKLAFGTYNKKFKPNRTPDDWLSVNAQNVDDYRADGLCGFDFTNNGYAVLFSVIKNACKKSTVNAVPENLPCLFVAGADDPVGDYGKGVKKAYNKFKKAGVKRVEIKLYENARHEILNDNCAPQVCGDILEFITGITK